MENEAVVTRVQTELSPKYGKLFTGLVAELGQTPAGLARMLIMSKLKEYEQNGKMVLINNSDAAEPKLQPGQSPKRSN